ncbi:MAG: MotA/TolQ/ExbB proton channel family protein [Verrucomicrobiales bacterium]|nr:MotA/TolQ/ExbB proton channel family protein [Verrucomicrobiales bacterium]
MTVSPAANRMLKMLLVAFAVIGGGLVLAPDLMAQEAAAGAEEAAQNADVTLAVLIQEGGWAMFPLFALSLGVVTLFVYNGMQLTQAKFAPIDLQAAVMEQMQACRVRSAIEISATSPTFLGRMLAHSLPQVDATDAETLGRDHVEDAMADFTVRENRGHMTWISYFSIVAQVAPMLGLLGTVSGMIKAFGKLRMSGGANPELLAGDISEALVTTATGLIIAIPALFGYFIFKGRLNKLVAESHGAESDMIEASIMAVNADQHMAKVPEGLQA